MNKDMTIRSKRKECVAKVQVRPGTGQIRVNKFKLDAWANNKYMRDMITLPLKMADAVIPNISQTLDFHINVKGGGIMGQVDAIRNGIARALVAHTENETLKKVFEKYDRSLLVEDHRRVEPKKYLKHKARARFQKSYR